MPTVAPSSTPLPPAFAAKESANCYSGPGETSYVLVTTFEQGEKIDAIGRDSSNMYWIVMDPKSGKGCWIEQKYVTAQGEVYTLPALVPPPTVVARPNAPSNLEITFKCQKTVEYYDTVYQLAITLTWEDKSTNEIGFEVYENGKLWQTLDADTTEAYGDMQSGRTMHGVIDYEVLAFNEVGKSTRVAKKVTYQLMLRSKANRLHGIESAVSRLKCRKIEFGFESKMVHVSGAFQ